MKQYESGIGTLTADLDGTGQSQVIVFYRLPFNWRGDNHYAYVFPNQQAFEAALAAARGSGNVQTQDPPRVPLSDRLHLGARQYYPDAVDGAGSPVSTGTDWEDHQLFERNGRIYFYRSKRWESGIEAAVSDVFRLRASGQIDVVCSLRVEGIEEAYRSFVATPGVTSLLSIMQPIGDPGRECGTLYSGHPVDVRISEQLAAIRPWSEYSSDDLPENEIMDARTETFLERWSLGDIWTRREFQTLKEHFEPAVEAYAAYLERVFGISRGASKLHARHVVQQLVIDRIQVPSGFSEEVRILDDDYFPQTAVRLAIMQRDRSALASALRGLEPGKARIQATEALSDSVEWPWGMEQLLESGADPNHPNWFGKTPLMVAAHLNRVDTAMLLLEHGARVDAATGDGGGEIDCGELLRPGRTALSYATENASPVLVQRLLEKSNGAAVPESSWRMQINPRLTARERSAMPADLPALVASFRQPSFACSKARKSDEIAICHSEVLSIFDVEIQRAYSEFHKRTGTRATADQRRWLARRSSLCADGTGQIDCLAELMRTRIRYLHNRNMEGRAAE